jgi:BlaI family penicillinase repressor
MRINEMPISTLYELGAQQREIVEAVWSRGQASVRDVQQSVAGGDRLAYTSVLSAMQKLERVGWLRHERRARRYVYRVTFSRRQAERAATRKFLQRVYRGDLATFLADAAGSPFPEKAKPSLRSRVDLRRGAA